MHIKFALFAAFIVTLAIGNNASAFSRQGHEAIARLAYESPDLSPTAKAAIDKILGTETIAFAAEWPDAVKPPFGTLASTPEAKAFNHAHPHNKLWHFVNFPIGSTAYSATSPYAVETDIIHAAEGCIAVLEGTGSFDSLTKLDALRYLVHLVGDIHQPLHTTYEDFDITNPTHPFILPSSPTIKPGALRDGGGNDLYYTDKKELHADWDDDLVAGIVQSKDTAKLVDAMKPEVTNTAYKATGDYHKWAEVWLGDSMLLVPAAFAGITFDSYIEPVDSHGRKQKKILITLPDHYRENHISDERTQIIKGGSHLLQLFNAIKWAP